MYLIFAQWPNSTAIPGASLYHKHDGGNNNIRPCNNSYNGLGVAKAKFYLELLLNTCVSLGMSFDLSELVLLH